MRKENESRTSPDRDWGKEAVKLRGAKSRLPHVTVEESRRLVRVTCFSSSGTYFLLTFAPAPSTCFSGAFRRILLSAVPFSSLGPFMFRRKLECRGKEGRRWRNEMKCTIQKEEEKKR